MRWKPDGREGIEDRRWQNDGPSKEERKGTIWESAIVNDRDYHDKVVRDNERDNYLRRTEGLPERPLPPEHRPINFPGQLDLGLADQTTTGDNLSIPQSGTGTNPMVESMFDPRRLESLRQQVAARPLRRSQMGNRSATTSPRVQANSEEQAMLRTDKLRSIERIQDNGLLERAAVLRKAASAPQPEPVDYRQLAVTNLRKALGLK